MGRYKKIDILLMSPPSRMINHYRPPLALMYVAEYYRQQGKTVKIIDVPMKKIVRTRKFWNDINRTLTAIHNEMIKQAYGYDTDTIGISCYSPELSEVKKMVYDLTVSRSPKIIVGGIHPSLQPEDFKGWAEPVKGRCDIGKPAYDLINMEYYLTPNPYAIRGVYLRCAYVLSSIGCPYNCKFCASPTLRKYFGAGYIKTAEQLYNEITWLKERYAIDGFYVIDDLFTMDKRYVQEFCGRIKYSKLLWGCSSRINTINNGIVKQMVDSGCVQIDFGIERGSNGELKRIGKDQTVEDIQRVSNLCKRYKIRIFANMLVNIPGEQERDLLDIDTLLYRLTPDVTSINVFQSYLGVELPHQEAISKTLFFVRTTTRKHNSVWKNIRWHCSAKYIQTLQRSRRKLKYLKGLWILLWEIINQKFL